MFIAYRLAKLLDSLLFATLIAAVIVLPLFIDPNSSQIFALPKQTLLVLMVGALICLTVGKFVLEKQMIIRLSIFDKPALVVVATAFLSGIFSVTSAASLFGRSDFFVLSALVMSATALFAWLVIQNITSLKRWRTILDALTVSGGATAALFLVRAVFHYDVLGKLVPNLWNTIDVTNTNFGLWLLIVFMVAAGQLIKREMASGRMLLYFFVALESFYSLVVLGFSLLWWPLAIGLILLLVVGVSFSSVARRGWLVTLFSLFIIVVVFIVFGAPQSLQTPVPSEISLSLEPSWVIISHGLFSTAKNFLLGTGAGSFAVTFSEYRDASFNYNQAAAGLRFNDPFNTVLALVSEQGVLLTVSFIFFFVYSAGHLLVGWHRARLAQYVAVEQSPSFILDDTGIDTGSAVETALLGAVWLLLSGSFFALHLSLTLWWVWWLLTAMLVAGLALAHPDLVRIRELLLQETPEQSLAFSFVLILVVSIIALFGVWQCRLYLADRAFAVAVRTTDIATAERNLQTALHYRDNYDSYHAAMAQVYLNEAVQASQASKPNLQTVSTLVGQAVNEARRATAISPHSVALWENLATMYENAALLVPDASDWAIKSLQAALELEPSNAFLAVRLGDDYGAKLKKNDWINAIKQYQLAIDLKKDYVPAYAALANAYEENREVDKAVNTYNIIVSAAGDNIDVLYNYGRLLYNRNNRGDRDQASQIWEQVLQINPNHSNTLFSLGLLNELRGNRTKALEYYYKVKELNPNNKDIIAKISKLVGK